MNTLTTAASTIDLRVFQSLPGSTVVLLPDAPRFTIIAATRNYCKISGRTQEELLGKGIFEAFPPPPDDKDHEGVTLLRSSLETVLLKRISDRMPLVRYDVENADGTFDERYWSAINTPVTREDGTVMYIVHTPEEMTSQVKAERSEKKIKSLEESYNVFMQAPITIGVVKGPDYIIELANDNLLEIWGRTAEVIGKSLFEAIPELKEQGFKELLDHTCETREPFYGYEHPIRLIRHGKEELLYFDFVYKPFYEEGNSTPVGVLAVGYDVTRQVESRQKLQLANKEIEESESRFRTLAEALPQMVWMRNVNGQIEYGSQRWEDYSGIRGVSEAWKAMVHPEDWERVMSSWQKDSAKAHGYRYEVRLKNKEGEYRWHYASGEPIMDKGGNVLKWIGVLTDIHAQKTFSENLEKEVSRRTVDLQNSEKKLEDVVKQLERSNEDLQQFAHVASHDLKEPVRKIMTFGNRLKDELGKGISDKAAHYLSRIESASIRMYSMIDGVLLYSSMNALKQTKEVIELDELVQNIETDLEVMIAEKGAALKYSDLPSVEGSPILIYQLFYNLINNSLKFAKADERPLVEIHAEEADAEEITTLRLTKGRRYIKILLVDNGIGFEQSEAEKIFQAFTRLNAKDKYEGTGLGLSLCRKIVERHGGAIYAEGSEGKGAKFNIILPEKQ